MAFKATYAGKHLMSHGLIVEYGTFANTVGSTGGTITVNATVQPEIGHVLFSGSFSDGDDKSVMAKDVAANAVKLTTAADDSGRYWIIGKAS